MIRFRRLINIISKYPHSTEYLKEAICLSSPTKLFHKNVWTLKKEGLSKQDEKTFNDKNKRSHSNSMNFEEGFQQLVNLHEQMKSDIQNNFINYCQIRQYFQKIITNIKFNRNNSDTLIQVLQTISKYPYFLIDKTEILKIYQIVCHNLHAKTVQDLNILLQFVLKCDQDITQSPIFLEFIKFYLHVPFEEYKTKFHLDFQRQSIIVVFKKVIARVVQSSFMLRTPPYTRALNVIKLQKVLELLILNNETRSSLMVKKINYTIFKQIKAFYEEKMHQNLYHSKRVQLLKHFSQIAKVLGENIPHIQHENMYLRQLYIKLYLVNQQKGEEEMQNIDQGCSLYKFKGVVYMYKICHQFITNQVLKQTQNNQKDHFQLILSFMKQVEANFKRFNENIHKIEQHIQTKSHEVKIYKTNIHFSQKLEIINNIFIKDNKEYKYVLELYVDEIEKQLSSLHFFHNLNAFKIMFSHIKDEKILQKILNKKIYDLLSLQELRYFCEIFVRQQTESTNTIGELILMKVYEKILETDYQVISGLQIISMLQIHITSLKQKQMRASKSDLFDENMKLIQNIKILRGFILRYIADHQKQFEMKHFQKIVRVLYSCEVAKQDWGQFNDSEGNYPHSIFKEINEYVIKVQLLFGMETKQAMNKRKPQQQANY